MAFYVPPDSDVKLLSDVPLDSEHEHTLWFVNLAAQTAYFESKVVSAFSRVTYVRKNRGAIKLQVGINTVKACNYMMFKNTGFENKWFYAFINSVDYISNNVTQITFTIDQIQTWLFEMRLKQCFVEREHSATDNIGDNLLPENLELGEYIYKDYSHRTWSDWSVFIAATFHGTLVNGQWQFTDIGGSYLGGVFSGLAYREFPINSPTTAQNVVDYITQAVNAGLKDGIVSIFMLPSYLYDAQGYGSSIPSQAISKIIDNLDGYVPRNSKMFTYPYCFIEVQNSQGNTGVFRQEFFNSQVCEFLIESALSTSPSIACIPKDYKNLSRNMPEAIYLNPALICSYNTDLFKAYLAQSLSYQIGDVTVDTIESAQLGQQVGKGIDSALNKLADAWNNVMVGPYSEFLRIDRDKNGAQNLVGTASNLLNSVPNARELENISAGTLLTGGGLRDVYNAISAAYSYYVAPPHNNGNTAGDFLVSTREKGLWFFRRTITAKFAKIIDDYFSRYGYATNVIKVPNIHVRQNWTYTKTINCEIDGNLPTESRKEIQKMFNNGITFWSNPTNVGDYTVSNTIIV